MNLFIVDVLILLETIKTRPQYISVKEKLSLTESISVSVNHKHLSDTLYLRDDIRYSFANKLYVITDHLNLEEAIRTPKDLIQLYQSLNIAESFGVVKNNTIVDNIHLHEAFIFRKHTSRRSISDGLIFDEDFVLYKHVCISPNSQDPITGYSADCPVYIDTLPYIHFSGPNGSITVNAPDLGNADSLTFGRINKRSRYGDLIVKRIPLRPRSNTLKYTIHIHSPEDKELVRRFFINNFGKVLTLTDHENINYQCVLTHTPEFVEELNCYYTTELELMAIV